METKDKVELVQEHNQEHPMVTGGVKVNNVYKKTGLDQPPS